MLTLPFRLLANLLSLLRWAVEWLFLWPAVLSRKNRRHFVEIRVDNPFRLRGPAGFLSRLQDNEGLTYDRLDRALRQAEKQPHIEGLVVRLLERPKKAADLALLRDRLAKFRAHGKRIVLHLDSADELDLCLAGVADTVMMSPPGVVSRTGRKADLTHVRDLIRRFGVRGQFIHIGRYKTAFNRVSRSKASSAERQMTTDLLVDIERTLHSWAPAPAATGGPLVGKNPLPPAIAEQPFYNVSESRRAGLIQHQAYYDQVPVRLRAETGPPGFDPLGTYGSDEIAQENVEVLNQLRPVRVQPLHAFERRHPRPLRLRRLLGHRPIVAVVEATGIIASEGPRGLGGQQAITPQAVRRLFKRLRENPRFAGVVLAIDSPGGSALASDLIWREIRLLAKRKPVVACMRGVAASGGYYMAAAAHEIIASPITLTGSIGVIAGKVSASRLLERINVHGETLATSPFATMDSPREPFTPDQIAALRRTIRDSYARFVGRVALGRHLDRSRVHLLGRGRVYTGAQAANVGLVDSLGSIDDAIASVARRAEISRDGAQIVYMSLHRPSLRALLTGGAQVRLPWPLSEWAGDLTQVANLLELLKNETALALCDVILPGFSHDE